MTDLAIQKMRSVLLNACEQVANGSSRDLDRLSDEPYLLPALTLLQREIEEELALVGLAVGKLGDHEQRTLETAQDRVESEQRLDVTRSSDSPSFS